MLLEHLLVWLNGPNLGIIAVIFFGGLLVLVVAKPAYAPEQANNLISKGINVCSAPFVRESY